MALPTDLQLFANFSLAEPISSSARRKWKADLRDFSTKAELEASGTFNALVGNIPIKIGDKIDAFGSDGLTVLEITALTPNVITASISGGGAVTPAFGGMKLSAPVVNPIALVSTFELISGNTTPSINIFNFNQSANNELDYVGAVGKTFMVNLDVSYIGSVVSELICIAIGKDGLQQDGSVQCASTSTVLTDYISVSSNAIVTVLPGEKMNGLIANFTSTNSITVQHMSLHLTQIG